MEVTFTATLVGLRLKKAKIDKDGNLIEAAQIVVQMETPLDSPAVGVLARMFEQQGECRLETWQTEMPFIKAAKRVDLRTGEVGEG